jgi:hypothetical protein
VNQKPPLQGFLRGKKIGQMDTISNQAPFTLSRDPFDQLVLVTSHGARHVDLTPIRLFPYSDPTHWISLCDSHRKEIVCIADLAQLPPGTRELLEQELARREFTPVIQRIFSVSSDSEPSEWDVDTDRGRTKFVLKSEDDVRRLGNQQAMIIDAHGIRYLIPDVRRLDAASRHVLSQYV